MVEKPIFSLVVISQCPIGRLNIELFVKFSLTETIKKKIPLFSGKKFDFGFFLLKMCPLSVQNYVITSSCIKVPDSTLILVVTKF